jgi:predicted transcriptional regulator
MPRIRILVPDGLLQASATHAEQLGRDISELYGEAIERYIKVTANASAGALRSRHTIPSTSPSLVIEISEDLFQRAEKVAKRLGKKRHVMYAEAMARYVAIAGTAESALDRGHDLPEGAWRAPESTT